MQTLTITAAAIDKDLIDTIGQKVEEGYTSGYEPTWSIEGKAEIVKGTREEDGQNRYYNLINPSDRVTFSAPTHKLATVATFIMGEGMYAAHELDEEGNEVQGKEAYIVPMTAYGMDADSFTQPKFGKTVKELFDYYAGTREGRDQLAAVLRTFLPGDMANNKEILAGAAEQETKDDAEKFIIEKINEGTSSLNGICLQARGIAFNLDKEIKAEDTVIVEPKNEEEQPTDDVPANA